MTLQDFFTLHPKSAIAFSGGCDSAYLLHEASRFGADICAYYMNTPFQPAFELEDAKKFCSQYGIRLTILTGDVCRIPSISENTSLRCYHCKQTIFSHIRQAAREDGYSLLLDGTNASDSFEDRPGMQALQELEVLSPLRLCGLSKDEIREHSRSLGLVTHDKPAYACLATRIPTGTPITYEDLTRIEESESRLASLGFTDFRIRIFHHAARIQIPREQFLLAIQSADAIKEELSPYFQDVFLDLQERQSESSKCRN